jgi:hypothetical protein
LRWRGSRLRVEVAQRAVRCTLLGGDASRVPLVLYDEPLEVTDTQPIERPLRPRKPLLPAPPQPPGREPLAVTHG